MIDRDLLRACGKRYQLAEKTEKIITEKSQYYGEKLKELLVSNVGFFSNEVASPIEQILYASILFEFYGTIGLRYQVHKKIDGSLDGLDVEPQKKIGKYKVDFLISLYSGKYKSRVVIECDSRAWHDRNEKDRAYEKSRERFIQSEGYNILRFTGSEIFNNSEGCAMEISAFLMDSKNFRGDHEWK